MTNNTKYITSSTLFLRVKLKSLISLENCSLQTNIKFLSQVQIRFYLPFLRISLHSGLIGGAFGLDRALDRTSTMHLVI